MNTVIEKKPWTHGGVTVTQIEYIFGMVASSLGKYAFSVSSIGKFHIVLLNSSGHRGPIGIMKIFSQRLLLPNAEHSATNIIQKSNSP